MEITRTRARFKDAPWFPGEEEVFTLIGGAGGIGSWLSVLLARAGYQPMVFDFDIIEEHNIGGQLYGKSSMNKKKVDALQSFILDYCDMDIEVFDEKYNDSSITAEYVFAAFDNMKARSDMFENWYKVNKDNPNAIFIDGRLTMEQLQIFCVTPDKADEYRNDHLFDDAEVEEAPCTMKQTSHSAAMIASMMVSFFTNHFTNVRQEKKVRQVPFFYEYFIPLNMVS